MRRYFIRWICGDSTDVVEIALREVRGGLLRLHTIY